MLRCRPSSVSVVAAAALVKLPVCLGLQAMLANSAGNGCTRKTVAAGRVLWHCACVLCLLSHTVNVQECGTGSNLRNQYAVRSLQLQQVLHMTERADNI